MSNLSSNHSDRPGLATGDLLGVELEPGTGQSSRALRVVVHDYVGHPFQVQLSRELARRGMDVLHLHCGSFRTGKGDVDDARQCFLYAATEAGCPVQKATADLEVSDGRRIRMWISRD